MIGDVKMETIKQRTGEIRSAFTSLTCTNELLLRAETFAGIKLRVFCVFWSFSRKFLPLEFINHQNAKVF